MKVLVFGALNMDHVYEVDHFVRPGESLGAKGRELFCGGKGLNQAIALSRCGVETYEAGAVGEADSRMLIEQLKAAGVSTELIRKKEGPSGHAIIQKTPEGENGIIYCGGANQTITKEDVDFVLGHFSEGDFLILQNEINQNSYIVEKARKTGMKIVLNPSPMDGRIFDLPLSCMDYLILNEIEGAAMTGVSNGDSSQMLERLSKAYPRARIVLTLGKKGAIYRYEDKTCYQPAYPVKTVDTTAAGDTFTGFFIGSVMKGKSVEEALDTAAKAAAIAVGRDGASSSIPLLSEVELNGVKI